ncbi:MAG: hypothetical protein ABFD89_00930 [Bryobacteraceae bacterium]
MSLDIKLECKYCGTAFFEANVTHNLNSMAELAGLYGPIWQPDENGIETAADLIGPLEGGIAEMKANPERFRELNPENGWGSYDDFVPWLERLLEACREHFGAKVRSCR